MKPIFTTLLRAIAAQQVAGHALFQQLWVDGADVGSQCARVPTSNTPVSNVASKDMICNAGTSAVGAKCNVEAGGTITVEMHAQPGSRSCSSEAIGGAHHGPVMVYLSKVQDSVLANGSTGWFKIFQNGWAKNPSGKVGDDDFWGTKDLNSCCGRMSFKIPADIAAGDYLLRAEALALHTAGALGQAQFYMTCYQLSIFGVGKATPPTVNFPGAYKASDPGIHVDIHSPLSAYIVPGPDVYAGGSSKTPGGKCAGCDSTCSPGAGPVGNISVVALTPTAAGGAGAAGGCSVARFAQCGGTGYTGCSSCGSGSVCSAVSPPYYSQCV